jgi:hypothetical protein
LVVRAQLLDHFVHDLLEVVQVAVLDGEGDVGGVVVHDVLDDVIDDDVAGGDVEKILLAMPGRSGTP